MSVREDIHAFLIRYRVTNGQPQAAMGKLSEISVMLLNYTVNM